MILHGEAYVPPACPTHERSMTGKKGLAGDVENMEFFYSAQGPVKNDDGAPIFDATIQFFKRDAEDDNDWSTIVTSTELSADSELATKARLLDKFYTPNVDIDKVENAMRAIACERIASCKGVIKGECWALGETALRSMIKQVSG